MLEIIFANRGKNIECLYRSRSGNSPVDSTTGYPPHVAGGEGPGLSADGKGKFSLDQDTNLLVGVADRKSVV